MRHYAGLLTPSGAAATRLGLERNRGQRLGRLAGAATDRLTERVRPSRRRMRALVASAGGRLRWDSVPTPPPPGPAGAVVRPIAVATCDLDPSSPWHHKPVSHSGTLPRPWGRASSVAAPGESPAHL